MYEEISDYAIVLFQESSVQVVQSGSILSKDAFQSAILALWKKPPCELLKSRRKKFAEHVGKPKRIVKTITVSKF